jgi:hypothetical protein
VFLRSDLSWSLDDSKLVVLYRNARKSFERRDGIIAAGKLIKGFHESITSRLVNSIVPSSWSRAPRRPVESVTGPSGHEPRQWILFASSSIPAVSYSVFHPLRRVCFQLADIKFRSAWLHRSFSPSNAYVTENSPSVVFDPLRTPASGLKRHSRSCTRIVPAEPPDLMSERTPEKIFFQLPGLGNVKKAVVCRNADYWLNCTLLPSK